jgi:hypothetical protein
MCPKTQKAQREPGVIVEMTTFGIRWGTPCQGGVGSGLQFGNFYGKGKRSAENDFPGPVAVMSAGPFLCGHYRSTAFMRGL